MNTDYHDDTYNRVTCTLTNTCDKQNPVDDE